MEKEFVPQQESVELKELGFNEPCFGWYNWTGTDLILTNNSYIDINPTNAPTFSQAFRWFRERWGYDIHVRGTNFRASYVIGIPKEINMESGDGYPLVIDWDYIVDGTGVRKTYEEAELACLKKLIEIVKNK